MAKTEFCRSSIEPFKDYFAIRLPGLRRTITISEGFSRFYDMYLVVLHVRRSS